MAERRKHRKRSTSATPSAKRLSLLDLPPADGRDELPTNPAIAAEPVQRTTLIPIAAEPVTNVSLASLALAARRGAGVPAELPPSSRAPIVVVPTQSVRAIPSSMPPPVQMPSEPPRRREHRSRGTSWLRTLGVIVLSSSVGATVASLISGARSGLDRATLGEREVVDVPRAAVAASCAPAAPLHETPASVPAPAPPVGVPAGTSQEAPRIPLEALPLQPGRRAHRAAETISLDAPPSERRVRADAPRADAPREKPAAPSRAALSRAMGRAASAATSRHGLTTRRPPRRRCRRRRRRRQCRLQRLLPIHQDVGDDNGHHLERHLPHDGKRLLPGPQRRRRQP